MTHLLLSFLGRAVRDRSGMRRYDETKYDFGETQRQSRYFAAALLDELAGLPGPPDRMLLLGTSGSMWDDVLETLGGGADELAPTVAEAVGADRVDQALVDRIAPVLSTRLGRTVRAIVIPYARTEEEVLRLLPLIAQEVPDGSRLTVDLTHGLRHLPMIGLVTAFALEALKQVEVQSVWYGARDLMQDDVAPVLRLDGLVSLLRWTDALRLFDATGRLGHLGRPIGGGTAIAVRLEKADFLEQALRLADARKEVTTALMMLRGVQGPVHDLVLPALSERLAWASEISVSERQCRLAETALNAGDYVRAAILAFEAMISVEMETSDADAEDPALRWDVQEGLNKACAGGGAPATVGASGLSASLYRLTRGIRIALAHAIPPRRWDRQTAAALSSATALSKALHRSIDHTRAIR